MNVRFRGKADITLKVPSGMMPVNDASICNLAVTFAFKAGGPLNCSNWLRLLDRHTTASTSFSGNCSA